MVENCPVPCQQLLEILNSGETLLADAVIDAIHAVHQQLPKKKQTPKKTVAREVHSVYSTQRESKKARSSGQHKV